MGAGTPPRTPLGELTALPTPPSWWGGGLAAPPQEPHSRSRLCRPRASALRASLVPAPNFQTPELKSWLRPCVLPWPNPNVSPAPRVLMAVFWGTSHVTRQTGTIRFSCLLCILSCKVILLIATSATYLMKTIKALIRLWQNAKPKKRNTGYTLCPKQRPPFIFPITLSKINRF